MIIVIDTREQRPWGFPPPVEQEVGTLRTGDYAIKGDDQNFAIERKSGGDFLGTISGGWHRFVRELNRMDESGFVAKVIIVESDFDTFCFKTNQGRIIEPNHDHWKITPQFVMKRIAQLTMRNVSVIFAGTPELGAAIALRLFYERAEQIDRATPGGE